MAERTKPRAEDLIAVMRLLADVAALSQQPSAAAQVLVDGLTRLLGTDQSFLFVADGWRPGGSPRFIHRTLTTERDPATLRYFAEFGVTFPLEADPFCDRTVGDDRPIQTHTWKDVIPDRAAARQYPAMMDLHSSARISDGIVAFFRDEAVPGRVVGFSSHHLYGSGKLQSRERAAAGFMLQEIRSLIGRGHLQIARPAAPPLPPRLAQVLHRLLTGQSPKQIARELGISLETTREHIQRLYRHYGVNSREELTAKSTRRLPAANDLRTN